MIRRKKEEGNLIMSSKGILIAVVTLVVTLIVTGIDYDDGHVM